MTSTPQTLPETGHTKTPCEMAKRVGTLFVLAMQTNDAELRQAAHLDRSELGMQDGPVFLPIERLTEENERYRRALTELLAAADKSNCDSGACDRARSAITPTGKEG